MLTYDRATRGRFHPATIWGGLFLVASQVLRIAIGGTETWQSFAKWLISLREHKKKKADLKVRLYVSVYDD